MSFCPIVAEPNELLSRSFPYALWPLRPRIYHIQPLNAGLDPARLLQWLGGIARSMNRRCAVVLGPSECVYIAADGTQTVSIQPPTGGMAFGPSDAIGYVPE